MKRNRKKAIEFHEKAAQALEEQDRETTQELRSRISLVSNRNLRSGGLVCVALIVIGVALSKVTK